MQEEESTIWQVLVSRTHKKLQMKKYIKPVPLQFQLHRKHIHLDHGFSTSETLSHLPPPPFPLIARTNHNPKSITKEYYLEVTLELVPGCVG